ncbi:pyridoxal phosphate-dependent decarboxylase family protein [Aliiglaciecola litoralis]
MSELQRQLFLQQQNGKLLRQAADFSYQYLQQAPQAPAFPKQSALDLLSAFEHDLPDKTGDAEHILNQLALKGGPNTVHYGGGRYYGFVNGGVLPIGRAARWLADTWDQNAALYVMSPIAATLEAQCEKWLKQLFNLPAGTVAGLVTGTSVASLCGLAAARYRQLTRLNWDIENHGVFGAPKLRIILGRQTHGTVIKMLNLLGFGQQNIEWIDCDQQGRMQVDNLPELDASCILVLQAGNVCTGTFDHFKQIMPIAKRANAWVHVDGAFGLWAAASPEFARLTDGVEHANSWSVDGHKTLNTPYDCGIVLCDDQPAITHALHQQGSYIQHSGDRDSMMFTPDMSRRARGVELWACMAYLGRQGIAELVELLHHRALYFAKKIRLGGFRVINDVEFNQVLLRCDNDQQTQQTLVNIQQSGVTWCGPAKWQGDDVIRVSICSWATTENDIDVAVDTFVKARHNT